MSLELIVMNIVRARDTIGREDLVNDVKLFSNNTPALNYNGESISATESSNESRESEETHEK